MKIPVGSRWFWIVLLLLVSISFPIPTTTVPEWKVRFIDRGENPIANLPIVQNWQNSILELSANREIFKTNSEGYVEFPRRIIWSPLLLRIAYFFMSSNTFNSISWVEQICDVVDVVGTSPVYTGGKLPTQTILLYFDKTSIRKEVGGDRNTRPLECQSVETQLKKANLNDISKTN